ncbi:MAG: type I restriction endonuclease subunit R [Lamprocystis purpurea]|jgi:type I restriction enzyme R subunit|uniref:type I restriction endonuclease subunit R n=1 Tax=Lamprocystis purpurea TaxID=61598 RepID=UPI000360F5A2|nr:type I restriction endonuclease subunit R [Lamprocystis purpurea]MBV5275028.1 type I restriction endonuclease subunit R [Lamprocystis purpurea]
MAYQDNTPAQIRLDERNHVEKPLLDQLAGLGWEIIDLNSHQTPAQSHRDSFAQVVLEPVLREQLVRINPWLEPDQVDEVVKQITGFSGKGLLENNRHVHDLLLGNTTVSENRQTGEKSPTVRFIDFDGPDPKANNRFIAVCQFKVRILGTEYHIIPDIVLFINGLPVVVIECKSPKVKEPIPEAIEQLLRYSEQRGNQGEGSAPLFYFNQFTVVTCRDQAKFGTITTHSVKHFYRWADPYPRTLDELAHGAGSPNDQQRLVAGMLDHRNLLDLIRTFTLFATTADGKTIKIVGRYQQFRAVKLAVKRLLAGLTPRQRSGVIWHTQGSGKSLTMMFMVREMHRHPALLQWKIVFVTDRTQLEEQLTATSQGLGFTVKVADSISRLKELLRTDSSDLVMAMIHKFRDEELQETFPELNASPHILVMTDEAHRSQYSLLGANLDRAIPNAARIGYTGTPIDKTTRVFGDYIDKYSMRQAIEDGVTLEIVYEGRSGNAEVADQQAMDAAFADLFSDYNIAQRLQVLGYGSKLAYLEAEPIIAAKAADMVDHYLTQVFPNGYKAQVVASSREAAVRYRSCLCTALAAAIARLEQSNPTSLDLERLRRMRVGVVISGGQLNDKKPHLELYANPSEHKRLIASFKLPFDAVADGPPDSKGERMRGDVGILVVNNMLLTGFDAPIEQVLYLDQVIRAQNLLQAIARVNRVAGGSKSKGFVVDYVGIGHHLQTAIDNYDARERQEVLENLSFPKDELRQLDAADRAVMAFLDKYGLTDLTDYDAFSDLFYDEDCRFEYLLHFRELTRCLNLVFPARQALHYMKRYQALAEINALAAKHLRDERLSMRGIPQKLRALTDAHLKAQGIDQKVAPISILDEGFEAEVGKHKRTKTKAAEVEHAIRHHIEVELNDDPELQASFAAVLAAIFTEFSDNWEKIYEALEKLRQRVRAAEREETYGLNKKKQMPFFRMFRGELFGAPGPADVPAAVREEHGEWSTGSTLNDDQIAGLVDLTQQVFNTVERELKLTGFWESIPARNKLRAELLMLFLSPRFKGLTGIVTKRDALISRALEIAERNNDAILYAA